MAAPAVTIKALTMMLHWGLTHPSGLAPTARGAPCRLATLEAAFPCELLPFSLGKALSCFAMFAHFLSMIAQILTATMIEHSLLLHSCLSYQVTCSMGFYACKVGLVPYGPVNCKMLVFLRGFMQSISLLFIRSNLADG